MNPTSELYDSLGNAYAFFNEQLFDGYLPTVIFTVQRKKGVMGYFAPDRWGNMHGNKCHEIAINPSYIANSCLIEVLQTLTHEMVHCWQHCFGVPSRGHYHNREWAKKMIEIGLMPSATGLPGGSITGQLMSDYIIEDGKFFKVYEVLKEKHGFQLKWIDRIAADKVFDPAFYESPQPSTGSELNTDVGPTISSASKESISTSLPKQPVDEKTFAEIAPTDLFIAAPARAKNSKKKYTCFTCSVNIWGKPGLNIICGGCDTSFSEGE